MKPTASDVEDVRLFTFLNDDCDDCIVDGLKTDFLTTFPRLKMFL